MADRSHNLRRNFGIFTVGFVVFVLCLGILEQLGFPIRWIGVGFLLLPIIVYAVIGILNRASTVSEFYVADRRVPALFNGMAVSAEWISAASFIGLAGNLYINGYQGLAYILGWTGGYVLVALLLAPYLRKFGQFTVPDFLGERYEGHLPRLMGAIAAILASFVYVVAQIYGVGLITSRLIGVQFEIGVFIGLAGILVCSLLGGMKAVTWTQVAQYIIRIIAYLAPVVFLSFKVTGSPIPQIAYGEVLNRISVLENRLFDSPKEQETRALYQQRANIYRDKISRLPDSLANDKENISRRIDELKSAEEVDSEIFALQRARKDMPANADQARERWSEQMRNAVEKAHPPIHHTEAFPKNSGQEAETLRLNFLALVFCLTVGTAALPHILMRYYTTPTVRETRNSVFWSLFFISILYLTAPAYAVFAKYEIYSELIGLPIAELPSWVASWGKLGLVSVEDINGDGILQLAELTLNPEIIVLATPEIAGLPYVVSGLVAAGGLASALSTADGLLLTIAGALSNDILFKVLNPQASPQRRLVFSKIALFLSAALAAVVASQRPSSILPMVAWAFSIAASAFFPALVTGIFWKRANRAGAVAGMLVGLMVTGYYLLRVESAGVPSLNALGLGMPTWFGINSVSAGVFGVPAGFLTIIVVSLLTSPPSPETQELVNRIRRPG
jgi:cation/acetate symporter